MASTGGRPPFSTPPPEPGSPEHSWRGLAVGLAAGAAVVLLLIAIVAAVGGDDDPEPAVAPATSTSVEASVSTAAAVPSVTGTAPETTRKSTPLPIVAADDRRVVVLDQSGSAPPRTLFDLGSSSPSDQEPPLVGGVSLSGDGRNAYFDVVGTPPAGLIRRVPVAGGPAEEIGDGVGPSASPDGSLLAVIEAPEPDQPATLLLRPIGSGAVRRIDLGDGTCGTVAWAPARQEVAVDICSGGEPTTVAIVDVASAGVRQLTPPEGVTWSVPAYKPDGTLTLVEQRDADAVVVTLTPDLARVAASGLRRSSTTIRTLDWSANGDLLVCDADGIVVAAIGGMRPQQVATGYTSGAW